MSLIQKYKEGSILILAFSGIDVILKINKNKFITNKLKKKNPLKIWNI